ncbi:hypothetical protein ACFQ4O_04835 [Methylopila musalis]|uniref:Uncharacterized protein n=1 Tax=Methylopila musalis TaxID=1134781 RepID=A0ABW3Z4W9_9HYPH
MPELVSGIHDFAGQASREKVVDARHAAGMTASACDVVAICDRGRGL